MASDLTPETLALSLDFLSQALHHVDFLARVESVPELKQPVVLQQARYRYETYWLPLAAEHTDECLAAPLDIEWIWHCHMLAPKAYAADCLAIVNTIVPHTLRSQADYKSALEKSHEYWKRKFRDIPFEVDFTKPIDQPVPDGYESRITYAVIEAAGRQKVFYYQISLPHYKDRKYLELSLLRYRKFLYLKTVHPKAFSVPCFEMDLMWHTHLVNPLLYRKDTEAILGHVFNHDDTVNERSEGSKLTNSTAETTEHWMELFNEPFSSPGAMYRGQPPAGVLYKLSREEVHNVSTKIANVTLNNLRLKIPPELNLHEYKNVRISAFGCARTRNVTKWFTLSKMQSNTDVRAIDFEVNQESFTFDTKTMNTVNVELETTAGKLSCFGQSKETVGTAVYNMLPNIQSSSVTKNGTFRIAETLSDGSIISMTCTVSKPACGPVALFLQTGTTEPAIIPDNVQSLLGPVSLERIPSGTDRHCSITTIRLKNHLGKQEFSGKVIFSAPLMLRFIQILFRDQMVAVCHQIGCEQLPDPSQVDRDIITLSHAEGERALLIKNHAGDWGIVKAKVIKGGAEPTNGNKTTSSSPEQHGKLWLYLYKTSTGNCEEAILEASKTTCLVTLDSTLIDLQKGVIETKTDSLEVGERVALAFCVSLLQKMLLPKLF